MFWKKGLFFTSVSVRKPSDIECILEFLYYKDNLEQ